MSLKLKQFKGLRIIPEDGTASSSWKVLNKGEFVHAMGIQAPEGTQFRLNSEDGDLITIGRTQLYELDLRNGLGIINEIYVVDAKVASSEPADILIDVLYEDGAADIPSVAIEEAEQQ